MTYGDGTMKEMRRPDGTSYSPKRWRVYLPPVKDPATGKAHRPSRVVRGTKAEARKARDELKRELESGLKMDSRNITFGEFAREWQQRRENAGELALRTLQESAYTVEYLCGFIGGVRLRDLDARTVESLYDAVRADKSERLGRPISGTTMNKLHRILSEILKKAEAYDLIARNPCTRVKAPKMESVERRALSAQEAARLLDALDACEAVELSAMDAKEARWESRSAGDGSRSSVRGVKTLSCLMAVRIALATGMRLGEVCGLCWDCVDLSAPSVSVARCRTNQGTTKEPKSRAGVRTIAIDGKTAAHLAAWKARQRRYLASLEARQRPKTPVCCSDAGGFLDLCNLSSWWRAWRLENGFPTLKFHELRHTQATQLLAAGVDVKTVQTRLGHSSASLTLNQYAHAVPENDRAAADLIGELFAAKKPEAPENSGFRLVRTA